MLKYGKHKQKKVCPPPVSKQLLPAILSIFLEIYKKKRKNWPQHYKAYIT